MDMNAIVLQVLLLYRSLNVINRKARNIKNNYQRFNATQISLIGFASNFFTVAHLCHSVS